MGEHDWMVRTFTQSVPNPEWNVVVTHVPTGIQRQATGRGNSREAARQLRAEIEASLRYFDVRTVDHA